MSLFKQRFPVLWLAATAAAFTGCALPRAPCAASGEEPEVPRCLSCDVELSDSEPSYFVPTPRVWATPEQLVFLAEATPGTAPSAQAVVVGNATMLPVAISEIYVADDPFSTDAEGEAKYFDAEGHTDEALLDPGGRLRVEVLFRGSLRLRSALLVVETSHPGYASLVVRLAGKDLLMGAE